MAAGFKFIGEALYLPNANIVIISDLHLGYEESLIERGVFLPRFQYREIKKSLEDLFKKIKPQKKIQEIVILGDLKHEFGQISKQEWDGVFDLLDFLSKECEKIILIKGNHDVMLGPLAKRKNLEVHDFYVKRDMAFIHGHKSFLEVLDKRIKWIFVGHLHPAISIIKGVKKEIYKCFLVGEWKNKRVVVMPSFFPFIEGVDVAIEDTNLAFNLDLKNFNVYVVSGDRKGKVYDFGKLKDVGKLI